MKRLIVSYCLLFDIVKPFMTALHQAAKYGRTEVAILLINRGADVDIRTRNVSDKRDRDDSLS